MNTLTVIVIIIIALGATCGYMKGLVKSLLGVVFSVSSVVLAYLIAPFMYDIMVERTTLDDYFTEKISDMIEEDVELKVKNDYLMQTGIQLKDTASDLAILEELKEKAYGYDPDLSDQVNIIKNLDLPEGLKKELVKNNKYGVKTEIVADNFYDYVAKYIVGRVMRMIAFVASSLLVGVILAVIIIALRIVSKLPVIGGINKVGGALMGGVIGLIIVWIMFAVFINFPGQEICLKAAKQIEGSKILSYLQERNIFMNIINGIRSQISLSGDIFRV